MSTGWNNCNGWVFVQHIINLLGNEYWLEPLAQRQFWTANYKPTGK